MCEHWHEEWHVSVNSINRQGYSNKNSGKYISSSKINNWLKLSLYSIHNKRTLTAQTSVTISKVQN